MQGFLKIHVEFNDALRSPIDDDFPANFAPGQEKQACLQLLAAMNATGGHLLFVDGGLVFTPFSAIKELKITAPSIVGADLSDLSRLGPGNLI